MNLSTIGRYLFAIPFAIFGLFHFMKADAMAGMIPEWLPGGVFWVYLTGVALLLAGVAIIIGKQVRLAGMLLGVMLIIFVLTIHAAGAFGDGDEMAKSMAMTNMLKDLALAGGAFVIANVFGGGSK